MSKIWIPLSIIALYASLLSVMYVSQSKMIFLPTQLPETYAFSFSHPFTEHFIQVPNAQIHALSFEHKKLQPKGLVLYFHGNAGCLDGWGDVYRHFRSYGYDTFVIDYRGYGKSTGAIESEEQLFNDAQHVYSYIQQKFGERYKENIVIYGRSIGTGIASWLAQKHPPKLLVLETPYYDLPSLVHDIYPFVPKFLVRFHLANHRYVQKANYPVHIFHGTNDEIIPYEHGRKLSQVSPNIILHTIDNAYHNNIPTHQKYHQILQSILKEND